MARQDTSPLTTSLFRSQNFVAGEWVGAEQGSAEATLTVRHKYTGESLAAVPKATPAQMESAIVAAQEARKTFGTWSAARRQQQLERLHALLEAKREAFVDLIVQEAGKPLGYARGEIDRCLTTLTTAAAETVRFGGEVVPLDFAAGEGKVALTRRFPVGVVACITPFNFPLNLVLHKVAPALATGCPILLKPAPQAPLAALALTALIEEAGYPAGVISTLVCDNDVAEIMVRDDRVALLSFTGSDKVGWFLKSVCGKKEVALELGGNASVIIDEDCDLGKAAKEVAVGAFLYAGQICISTQRVYVHRRVFEPFKKLLVEATEALQVGDPAKEDVLVGPIIDAGHLERIDQWVAEAKERGATVLTGGKILDRDHNLYTPTLLTGVPTDCQVVTAEVFGPVAIVEAVEDFRSAIDRTNDSRYGLQAGVYTNSLAHMRLAHDLLEVGGVIVGGIPGFRVDSMPYGGVKDSGLGREGVRYAMEDMTEPRLLVY